MKHILRVKIPVGKLTDGTFVSLRHRKPTQENNFCRYEVTIGLTPENVKKACGEHGYEYVANILMGLFAPEVTKGYTCIKDFEQELETA